MYLAAQNTRTGYEQVIVRKAQQSREWLSEKLDSTETYRIESTHDGIGMLVFIRSLRAKQLLLSLHRKVFSPGFTEPKPWLEDNGEWSGWFGYSEPWPPMNYVSIQ